MTINSKGRGKGSESSPELALDVSAEVKSKRAKPKGMQSILIHRAAWTVRGSVEREEAEAIGSKGAVKEDSPVRCLMEIGERGLEGGRNGGEEEEMEMRGGVRSGESS